jgi:hypothetical protein
MSVRVHCNDPSALLNQINQKVREGSIDTWTIDSDGDFTHSPAQWKNKAWFRPRIETGQILFRIIPAKGTRITKAVYGVFHGRFIEMLISHFDEDFSVVTATALAVTGTDVVVG